MLKGKNWSFSYCPTGSEVVVATCEAIKRCYFLTVIVSLHMGGGTGPADPATAKAYFTKMGREPG